MFIGESISELLNVSPVFVDVWESATSQKWWVSDFKRLAMLAHIASECACPWGKIGCRKGGCP